MTGRCFAKVGMCVLNCPKNTCMCILKCPKNTVNGCNRCSKKLLKFCKRTQDKVCACCTKSCRKSCLKCYKRLLCCCLCKDCKEKKKKDKSSDSSDKESKKDKKMQFKLKGDELKKFIIENLLIFRNGDIIGYIALDNKDRIEHPGKTLVEFPLTRFDSGLDYIVRLLEYKNSTEMPLALTVHRTGDTTDCDKISFPRCDVYISGGELERFLR